MKASKYNFFYPYTKDNTKHIACNVLTSSLALIDDKHYDQYLSFINSGQGIQDKEFVESLKLGGFILDKNIDELDIIRYDMFKNKFNTDHLTLTIAPTLDCNFRCVYCYEKEVTNKCRMTKEISDSIIDYIKEKAKLLSSLNIAWYGGEPLLEIDTIEYLSNEILQICNEYKINYEASIVTNGYFLDEKTFRSLQKSKVSGIQITIDGGEATHNKRRPLFDGNPTFNTIMNNLQFIKEFNCTIHLRINVDKTNGKEAFDLADALTEMGLQEIVIPYLALVRNYNGCYKDANCIIPNEYLDLKRQFNNYIIDKGFMSIEDSVMLPPRISCFCSAERANSLIIDADGELYKCWNDIGNIKRSVGNVKNGVFKNPTYLGYVMSDPTKDKQCKDCIYLPICFSGCPSDRHNKEEITCLENKSKLKSALYSIIEGYSRNI